eukprot:s2433_g12.t1
MLSPVAAIAVLATEVCSASSKSVSPTPIGRRCKLTRIQQLLRQNPLFLSSPETQRSSAAAAPDAARQSGANRRQKVGKAWTSQSFGGTLDAEGLRGAGPNEGSSGSFLIDACQPSLIWLEEISVWDASKRALIVRRGWLCGAGTSSVEDRALRRSTLPTGLRRPWHLWELIDGKVGVNSQVFSDVMDGFMVMTRRGIGLAYCTTGQREHDFAAGWTDFGSGSADIPMTNAGYQGLRNCKPGRRSCSLRSWKHGNWTDWTHRTYAIGYIDAGHGHQRGFPES